MWNIIDVASTFMVVTFIICDLSQVDYTTGKDVASVATFLLWLKMFYYLRILGPTSVFIRMVIEVTRDMGVFTFMFFMVYFAFTNSFHILDGGATSVSGLTRASGDSIWDAFTRTYQMGLGEWDTDNYGANPHTLALWLFFILCTVFIQIVFLNMLIAIISDTFDKVQEIKE